jgi:hypothetical protein
MNIVTLITVAFSGFAVSALVMFVRFYGRMRADQAAKERGFAVEARVVDHVSVKDMWANVYEARLPDGSLFRQTSDVASSWKTPLGTIRQCHYESGPPKRLVIDGPMNLIGMIATAVMAFGLALAVFIVRSLFS